MQHEELLLSSSRDTSSIYMLPSGGQSYLSFIHKKWTQFSEKHHCALIPSLRKTSIIKEIIDSGMFINFRRRWRQLMMISDRHPYTRRVFKSKNEIENEEIKHLVKYYWTIHPFSMGALYFDFFMVIIYFYTLLVVIPTNWMHVRYYPRTKWHTFAFDMIITVSIFWNFFIGYFDQDTVHVQLRGTKIVKKYLLTYFFFDLASCSTSYMIYFFLMADGPSYLNLLKWSMACRLVRFKTMNETLDILRLYYGFSAVVYVCIQIVMTTFLTVLSCLGLAYFVHQIPFLSLFITEEDDQNYALNTTFSTVTELFGVGRVPNFEKDGEYLQFVFIAVSMLLHFWIIAKLFTLWQRILVASQIGEDHVQQIGSYLEYKGLPLKTRDEIYCYFDFTYQKKFFNETTILNIMSENLRKEIPNYKLGRAVEKIKFIKVLPVHVVMIIAANMAVLYYSAGDVVFKAGTTGAALFYIKYGTVALFDKEDIEVCHLEDDSYYGDTAVVIKQMRPVTMMAISPCEIYKLEQRTLLDILDSFPALKEKVFDVTRQILLTRRFDWASSHLRTRQRKVSILS